MAVRRTLSIVAALLLTVFGELALLSGGVANYRAVSQFAGDAFNPGTVVIIVLGVLLLAAVAATIAISSAGAIVVGAMHVVWGLLVVLLPFDPLDGFRSPLMELMLGLRPALPSISDGLFFFVPTGFGILVGAILITAGLAARRRAVVQGTGLARAIALVAAVVAVPGGLVLVLIGGGRVYANQLRYMTGTVEVVGVAMLLVGVVLVAAVALTVRWSSLGAIVVGGVFTAIGVALAIHPLTLGREVFALSRELAGGLQLAAPMGNIAVVGAVLAVAGLAAKWRARRASAVPSEQLGMPAPTGAVYDG